MLITVHLEFLEVDVDIHKQHEAEMAALFEQMNEQQVKLDRAYQAHETSIGQASESAKFGDYSHQPRMVDSTPRSLHKHCKMVVHGLPCRCPKDAKQCLVEWMP